MVAYRNYEEGRVAMGMIRVGIVGKTNTGKTTFFNAATLLNAEIQPYPFTTKQPNIGIAHVSSPCVCREFGVKCQPRNSVGLKGKRSDRPILK